MTIILVVTVIFGLYMAWNIGANDAANSMADAVGSRSLSIKWAIILAGVCELAGAVLVGSHVTNTVRKGIVSPEAIQAIPGLGQHEPAAILAIGMAAALLGAAVWLNIATVCGMPVSTTHSIVGAVAGFGVVAAGWNAVEWGTMGKIVGSWFVSPVMGGMLGFCLFKFISWLILQNERPAKAAIRHMPFLVFLITSVVTLATVYKGLKNVELPEWLQGTSGPYVIAAVIGLASAAVSYQLLQRRLQPHVRSLIPQQLEQVERAFMPLVIITSCAIAFAHGANDVANSIGPLAAVMHIVRNGTITMKAAVPWWILALGGIGIVLGLATFGYRVMRTIGEKITQLTPSRGVAADTAATATVLVCTLQGWPISTTHVLVGSVMGVGFARGLGAVDRRVARSIFGSWLITVPAAAVLAILFFLVGRAMFLESVTGIVAEAAARGGA